MLRFIVLLCALLPLTSRFGQDSFEVYLKGKLLTRDIVNPSQGLHALQLAEANASDEIVIHYVQCNAPGKIGKSRSIFLKNNDGQKIKEWKFADAANGEAFMSIPVKDILQLKKMAKGLLTLYYSAVGREYGQAFASL